MNQIIEPFALESRLEAEIVVILIILSMYILIRHARKGVNGPFKDINDSKLKTDKRQ